MRTFSEANALHLAYQMNIFWPLSVCASLCLSVWLAGCLSHSLSLSPPLPAPPPPPTLSLFLLQTHFFFMFISDMCCEVVCHPPASLHEGQWPKKWINLPYLYLSVMLSFSPSNFFCSCSRVSYLKQFSSSCLNISYFLIMPALLHSGTGW